MITCKKALASIFVLSALGGASFAMANPQGDEAKTEPMYWPATPRPSLGISSYYSDFDGILVPMYSIQSGALSFELSNRKNISIQHSSSARYSGEFSDSRQPGITMGLSTFDLKEFLPDLSEESWKAYKTGLLVKKPNLKVVFENSNIDAPATPYVFGKKFRQIAYESASGQAILKSREIFAIVGQNLLVFTINGTKETVDQHWTSIENLISEMTLN